MRPVPSRLAAGFQQAPIGGEGNGPLSRFRRFRTLAIALGALVAVTGAAAVPAANASSSNESYIARTIKKDYNRKTPVGVHMTSIGCAVSGRTGQCYAHITIDGSRYDALVSVTQGSDSFVWRVGRLYPA